MSDFPKSEDMTEDWNYKGIRQMTIESLDNELKHARKKFPKNRHLTIALSEEVGELAKAQLQGKMNAEIKKEALQVACVAIRIFEEGDAYFNELEEEAKQP